MPLRVGIDLASVELVRDSLATHAEHYVQRVYTQREVEDCTTPAGVDPERLAARFAAKEAALKVLRPGEVGVPLSAIEVVRDPDGPVSLQLSGPAAVLAAEAGITELALSVTHDAGVAAAVVIATGA
jgi:holo-[acyl-carrier protein] synthase